MATTISVSEETRDALQDQKRDGESYDAYLSRTALSDGDELTENVIREAVREETGKAVRDTLENLR